MCGIISWNGSIAPDMNKLKILGIANEERGIHSAGYFYNGEIFKGVKEQAQFRHLINKYPLKAVEGANVFIGHTRSATYGEHSLENAHPFLIQDKLVIVHNGTLEYPWRMCDKYKIDHTKIHVDSLALGCLLDKEGSKILEEYEGKAAIVMHYLNEPDASWVYHGASKIAPDGEEVEERPLYYLKTASGIYFSSLRYALELIKECTEHIEAVPHNKLIKVVRGEFVDEILINRGNCNIVYPTPLYTKTAGMVDYSNFWSAKFRTAGETKLTPKIWKESFPNRSLSTENLVYWHKGRYWQTIELVKGTETQICHGKLNLTKKGGIVVDGEGDAKYFYNGVMLKSVKDFDKLLTAEYQEKLKTLNVAAVLSKFSTYPVTNLEDESINIMDSVRFLWYKDGGHEKSGFTPKFSNRTYTFRDGVLMSVKCDDSSEFPLFLDEKKEAIITPFDTAKKTDLRDNEKEKLLEEVMKELEFFQKNWTNTDEIIAEINNVGNIALEAYLRDSSKQLKDKELNDLEVGAEMDRIFTEAVLNNICIEDVLDKTGDLIPYIEDAIAEEKGINNQAKKVIDVTKFKKEISDEFVFDPKTNLYVPKDEMKVKDEDLLPFPLDKRAEVCGECGGIGITDEGICRECGGAGLKKKKGSQLRVFDDAELDVPNTNIQHSPSEMQKAIWVLSDVIVDLRDVEDNIEDLSVLKSELSNESSEILKPFVKTVKRKILSIAQRYNLQELIKQINKKTEKVC